MVSRSFVVQGAHYFWMRYETNPNCLHFFWIAQHFSEELNVLITVFWPKKTAHIVIIFQSGISSETLPSSGWLCPSCPVHLGTIDIWRQQQNRVLVVDSMTLLSVYFRKHLVIPHKYLVNICRDLNHSLQSPLPVVKVGMPLLQMFFNKITQRLWSVCESCESCLTLQAEGFQNLS